jgi:osmotically-inducible protein OsmY
MQDRNWDRVFEDDRDVRTRNARDMRGGGTELYRDRPPGHRERPWHPGDGPQGVRPGDLRPHVNQGYDHQEQYERSIGVGHGRGGYAGSQTGAGREAWGSLGGGYGEQQIGQAGPSNANVLGTRGTQPATRANRGPLGYRREDTRIYEDVCEALAQLDHVDVSEVEVVVEKGEVTLSGTVDQRQARHAITEIAESVRGVEQVFNRIRVRRAGDQSAV